MFPVPHKVRHARENDLGELFTLTRAAFVTEAQRYRDPFLPPLAESLETAQQLLDDSDVVILTAVCSQDGEWGRRGRIVGALRLSLDRQQIVLGRLVVAPDLQGRGIGSSVLTAAIDEGERHPDVRRLLINVANASSDVLAIYRRHGFSEFAGDTDSRGISMVVMVRPV